MKSLFFFSFFRQTGGEDGKINSWDAFVAMWKHVISATVFDENLTVFPLHAALQAGGKAPHKDLRRRTSICYFYSTLSAAKASES